MKKVRTLRELFSFPGFYAQRQLQGVFGDPKSRIVQLTRQKKVQPVPDVERAIADTTIPKYDRCVIGMPWNGESISALNNGE